jgi:hypothetical protein
MEGVVGKVVVPALRQAGVSDQSLTYGITSTFVLQQQ